MDDSSESKSDDADKDLLGENRFLMYKSQDYIVIDFDALLLAWVVPKNKHDSWLNIPVSYMCNKTFIFTNPFIFS